MAAVQRPRVFLDVSIGDAPAGRLTIELFADKAPRTCENFRQLCTGEHNGLSYAKAPFHRVIDEFMVQGGDIEKGDGTGTSSIYGGEYEDENLDWRDMDVAGLICSANRGKHTNGSQYVQLDYIHNGKAQADASCCTCSSSREDTLQKIANVSVHNDDRPREPVLIARCGELEKKKKKNAAPAPAPQPANEEESQSRDRGRRRRSDSEDVTMENTPEQPGQHKHARQSDKSVDEGLRGRPRQRSASRSPSRPLSVQEEEEQDDDGSERNSPAKVHKRKRSASPSRQPGDSDGHERRRRSLPNQYRDKRIPEDEDRYRPSPRRDDYRHAGRRHDDSNRGDRYRPKDRNRYEDEGRLGGGDGRLGGSDYDDHGPPVKFKGRGVMKYREPDRAW